MILYHGSYTEIKQPDILHSRQNVDFGAGFYTTPIYQQALQWCNKFKKRQQQGVISYYAFDTSAYNELNVMTFDTYSEAWLDFILTCRSGQDTSDFDIVIGGVANDKVFNTVELFYDGLIDKKEAIKRLRFEKPNEQVCFRTQLAIDNYLQFERSESV